MSQTDRQLKFRMNEVAELPFLQCSAGITWQVV